MEENLDASNCYSYYMQYRQIAYAAMVRGVEVKMITHSAQVRSDPAMLRAGLVSLMSYKFKRIFSEPMLISMLMGPECALIIDMIKDKVPSDFGLEELYSVDFLKKYVEVSMIPTVRYTNHIEVELKSERKAYEMYSIGKIGLDGWGSIVSITKTPIVDTLCHEIVETRVDVVEEREIVEQLYTASQEVSSGIFVAPPLDQIVEEIGTIDEAEVSVIIKSPGQEDIVHNYVEDAAIIPFTYSYVCNVVYKYRVRYSECQLRRYVADDKLMIIDRKMRSDLSRICRAAYDELRRVNIANCGWSEISRTLHYVLTNMRFPSVMPEPPFVYMIVSLATGIPIYWDGYAQQFMDWRDSVFDSYDRGDGLNWITNYLSFLDSSDNYPIRDEWGFFGTFEQFERYLKYQAGSGYDYYDFSKEVYFDSPPPTLREDYNSDFDYDDDPRYQDRGGSDEDIRGYGDDDDYYRQEDAG